MWSGTNAPTAAAVAAEKAAARQAGRVRVTRRAEPMASATKHTPSIALRWPVRARMRRQRRNADDPQGHKEAAERSMPAADAGATTHGDERPLLPSPSRAPSLSRARLRPSSAYTGRENKEAVWAVLRVCTRVHAWSLSIEGRYPFPLARRQRPLPRGARRRRKQEGSPPPSLSSFLSSLSTLW